MKLAILGNSGGGKSTLVRKLSRETNTPLYEIDGFLWREDWQRASDEAFNAEHDRILDQPAWILDGLGPLESVQKRLSQATAVILIDLPLWQHFWLAAERQIAWAAGDAEGKPGGYSAPPPTKAVFENIWSIDQDWMQTIREHVTAAERFGADVYYIESLEELEGLKL